MLATLSRWRPRVQIPSGPHQLRPASFSDAGRNAFSGRYPRAPRTGAAVSAPSAPRAPSCHPRLPPCPSTRPRQAAALPCSPPTAACPLHSPSGRPAHLGAKARVAGPVARCRLDGRGRHRYSQRRREAGEVRAMTTRARHETRALLRAHLSAAASYRHLTRHCPICHQLLRLAMEPHRARRGASAPEPAPPPPRPPAHPRGRTAIVPRLVERSRLLHRPCGGRLLSGCRRKRTTAVAVPPSRTAPCDGCHRTTFAK